MARHGWKEWVSFLGDLTDVDVSDAIPGDGIVLGEDGIWRRGSQGGGGGGLPGTRIFVDAGAGDAVDVNGYLNLQNLEADSALGGDLEHLPVLNGVHVLTEGQYLIDWFIQHHGTAGSAEWDGIGVTLTDADLLGAGHFDWLGMVWSDHTGTLARAGVGHLAADSLLRLWIQPDSQPLYNPSGGLKLVRLS